MHLQAAVDEQVGTEEVLHTYMMPWAAWWGWWMRATGCDSNRFAEAGRALRYDLYGKTYIELGRHTAAARVPECNDGPAYGNPFA